MANLHLATINFEPCTCQCRGLKVRQLLKYIKGKHNFENCHNIKVNPVEATQLFSLLFPLSVRSTFGGKNLLLKEQILSFKSRPKAANKNNFS